VGPAVSRTLALRRGGDPLTISYDRKGNRISLDLGDRRFEADVSRKGLWFEVRSGDRVTRCAVARGRRQVWVSCEGRTYLLEEEHPETAAKGGASTNELRAPMTGRVVQVSAEKGTAVREGDILVTIEAMKMEFRLAAPEDGVVADVRCGAGERVELGDLLVVLEPRA
jgi:acetyl/propionyl-CoA carboxylase alpha subunit